MWHDPNVLINYTLQEQEFSFKGTDMHLVEGVYPRWVLVNRRPHDVSDFASLPPRQRPEAYCPICRHLVILKLGDVRVHHYAHYRDENCPATEPETALHLNVKFYIARQLERRLPLVIEQPCAGEYQCGSVRRVPWLDGWEEVHVEYSVDHYQPDIALLRDGQVLGAIEVLVTHAVESGKADYFARLGVSWLEVRATESLYAGESRWLAEQPLTYVRLFPCEDTWVCENCQEKRYQDELRQKAIEIQRLYQKRNRTYIHAAKMVDFYYPSGKKYREVFYTKVQIRDGKRVKAWVEVAWGKVIGQVHAKSTLSIEDFRVLTSGANDYIAGRAERSGALTDTVAKWRHWVNGEKFHPADIDRYPFRYEWFGEAGEWHNADLSLPLNHYNSAIRQNTFAIVRRDEFKNHVMGRFRPTMTGDLIAHCTQCGKAFLFDGDGKLVREVDEACPASREV